MGSGNLFKAIIGSKKAKEWSLKKEKKRTSAAVKSKAFKKNTPRMPSLGSANGSSGNDPGTLEIPVEDLAAIRIQTAFRAYKARKSFRHLKQMVRAKSLTERQSVKKQVLTTLGYLHSWSQIQSQIKARRVCMVTEGRLKQKKLENQQKLEAKLHDVEVEWNGGPETKEEILGRIHHREEAAVKRERALAYAFSHQWRVDGKTQWLGSYELSNTNWGWSWKERWIAARPWEVRYPPQSIAPRKPQSQSNKVVSKTVTNISSRATKSSSVQVKTPFRNKKNVLKPRRLSFPGAEKPAAREVQVAS